MAPAVLRTPVSGNPTFAAVQYVPRYSVIRQAVVGTGQNEMLVFGCGY